jgi:hypothetical protein
VGAADAVAAELDQLPYRFKIALPLDRSRKDSICPFAKPMLFGLGL